MSRLALLLTLALGLLCAPLAQAQQIVVPPAPSGGGGANLNLDNTYDIQGLDADGAMTSVASSGSANVLGTPQPIYTAPADLAGFCLYFRADSATPRFQASIRKGASTYIVSDYYIPPGAATGTGRACFPLNAASGDVLNVAIRSGTASATLRVAIQGIHRNSQSPPSWTSLATLHVDTAATRAGTATVTSDDGWDQVVGSTAAAYGGLMFVLGETATAPVTGPVSVSIGTGNAAEEVAIFEAPMLVQNSVPRTPHGNSMLIEKAIGSGVRLTARVKSATNTDTFYVWLGGLVP